MKRRDRRFPFRRRAGRFWVSFEGARLKVELTQEELSERTGVDQSDISKLEKGTLNPSVGLMRRVAKGLEKSISIVLL